MHGVYAIDQDHQCAVFAFDHLNGLFAGNHGHEDASRRFDFLNGMSGRVMHCELSWLKRRIRRPTQGCHGVKIVGVG